jgi:riboflavin synthase
MFTGIVEAIGKVARVQRTGNLQHTTVECPEIMDGVGLGDSIAVDGVCQTVTVISAGGFTFDSVSETLQLTTIGAWQAGRAVNVERSLKVGARLGGHWVLGHVDGVTRYLERRQQGDAIELRCAMPRNVASQVAKKGSVTIDGISLTVTDVDADSFGVAVIPFTLSHTTLGQKRVGDALHLETDVLAKYVGRLIEITAGSGGSDAQTMGLLRQAGFVGA